MATVGDEVHGFEFFDERDVLGQKYLPDLAAGRALPVEEPERAIGAKEFGTYFIGCATDPGITEEMLRHMFIGKPPGKS